ncbi:hypothetical protein Lal_00035224 [Lupinus albus]|nr:hypothetical protein Lal_00035224 [Lupinus albus]
MDPTSQITKFELTIFSAEDLHVDRKSATKNLYVVVRSESVNSNITTMAVQGNINPLWNMKFLIDMTQSIIVIVIIAIKKIIFEIGMVEGLGGRQSGVLNFSIKVKSLEYVIPPMMKPVTEKVGYCGVHEGLYWGVKFFWWSFYKHSCLVEPLGGKLRAYVVKLYYDEGRRYDHMTINLAECINGLCPSVSLSEQHIYHMLNSWFLHHRNEATIVIKASHIYCEEFTKVINENNHKATCQLVRSFPRESGVSKVDVAGRDGGRHSRVFTVRLNQNWCDWGEFQSLRLSYSHAIAKYASLNLDFGQFISPIY